MPSSSNQEEANSGIKIEDREGNIVPAGYHVASYPALGNDIYASDKVYFAIVTAGRQGSTYLERLLHSHPDASYSGEIFSPAVFKEYGLSAVEEHLHTRVHMLSGKAVGFKLSLQDTMNHPEVLGLVKKYNYRVIQLSRNLVDQFISGRLAIANDAWTSDNPGRGIRVVETNFDEMKAGIAWTTFADSILKEATSSLVSMGICFDDLVNPENHSKIYDFLEIENLPLPPVTKRQHPGSQRERLKDYDKYKEMFANTRWADQFLD